MQITSDALGILSDLPDPSIAEPIGTPDADWKTRPLLASQRKLPRLVILTVSRRDFY
jgi:hypothetical protein